MPKFVLGCIIATSAVVMLGQILAIAQSEASTINWVLLIAAAAMVPGALGYERRRRSTGRRT